MLLLAILTGIMLVAMGVPSPLLLGIQAGLFEFIPYLGAVVGAVPILLLALPLGNFTLWVTLGLYAVIHFVVGNIMVPMMQKRTLDLPPAVALASLAFLACCSVLPASRWRRLSLSRSAMPFCGCGNCPRTTIPPKPSSFLTGTRRHKVVGAGRFGRPRAAAKATMM